MLIPILSDRGVRVKFSGDVHTVMKQFESPEASLPTPSKLDLKIMKETTEDTSRDSHNNGQLRLPSSENVEVQNGSKKLLEIADFNSSKRVVCDSSLKKDIGRISGTSEKENVIANGLPYGCGSVQTAQSDETEECAHRTETVDFSSDHSGQESAKLGAEDLLDTPEDNIGNESTLLVSGSGVSDEDQAKSVDDVSKLTNGPLSSDNIVNSATDIKSAGNSKEQQFPINGEILGEASGVGKGGKPVSSTIIQDQIIDEPPLLEQSATERLSEPEVEQTEGEAEALNCDSTVSCGVGELSSPAETSKLLEDVNLDSSSRGPLEAEGVVAQDTLLKTQKEFSRDTDSLDGPVEVGDSLSEVREPHDGLTFVGELHSLERPIEDEADEPDSMQETLKEFSSHDEPVEGETHSLQEPNEDGVPKKDCEQDSLEGPLEQHRVGLPEELEVVNEPNSLQDPVEEDSVSHSLADEACESDSLQGSTGKVPDSTKVCPSTELMDFEEHFSDSIETTELEPSDEAMDTDELMDTKLDSPDEVECKSLGSLNEDLGMETLEQTDAEMNSCEDLGMETLEQTDAEMNSCDSIAEAKDAVLADKLENAEPVVKSKEVSDPDDELDDSTESELTNLLSGKDQTSFSEELLKNTKLQGCDDSEVKDQNSPNAGYELTENCDPKEKRSTITVTDESGDVPMEPGNKSVSAKSAIDLIDDETCDMDVESAKCRKNEILKKNDSGEQGEIPIAGNSVKEFSESTSDKSFSKVSFRQLNSDTQSVTTNNLDDKGTPGASFGEDFEDDLRAMEESMWLDDIDKSKSKIPSKTSTMEKSSSDAAHHNNAEPREERLNRKRSSEIEGASETPKRSKLSTSGEEDSDLSSETSRDCDSVLKRPSENALDRLAKKVRTVEEGKEKAVYQSNLDRIIDQVATGVINTEHDDGELQVVGSADSGEVEGAKSAENNSEPKEVIPMPFMRKLNSSELKNLTKNAMEELVVQKVCESITERCDVGDLRQRTQFLEQMVDQWRKKAQQLTKQVRDMEMVIKRYANDQRTRKGPNIPVKITRSVGLQVNVGLTAGPIGFAKTKPVPVPEPNNRPQVRRKPERSVPAPAPPPANSTAKTSVTPTSTPSTPQKITSPAVSKATTNVSSTNSPASSPIVKQVTTQASAVKTVSTPVKTNVSRPTMVNPSAVTTTSVITSTNSPARSGTTTVVSNRVVKSSTTSTTPMPIAPKPSQDLIDLTDEEDRVKGNALRNALTVATDALVPTTGSITSVLPSNAITTTVAGRGIRVVQPHQLTGNSTTTAAILAPTGTTNNSGHRLAYLVPTTAMPAQQRQVLLAGTPQQMRMSVSGRPTIVFKSAQVPSMSQTGMPPGTMVQAGVPTSSSAIIRPNSTLTTLPTQQRPSQLRMPTATMATSVGRMGPTVNTMVTTQSSVAMHPAPLPSLPPYAPTSLNLKLAPPKPELKISKVPTKTTQGIVLSWNMTLSAEHEEVASYQLYAYQEGTAPPSTTLWKKVGDVKALPLPMACTLTQFQEGHKYHFAVRAVDVHMRCGQFSAPGNIMLTRK